MSITFHMRREGQFTANFGTRNGQCGTGGQQIYSYVCEIVVGPKLDAQGFILDNYKVQGYFDREYSSKADAGPAQSCERMAELAASHFASLLISQGREVKRVSCTVSGSALAGLTAVWEPEQDEERVTFDEFVAEQDAGLGIADVWHQGSRSFYRAKLLRKLTPEEANFDPADPAPETKVSPVSTELICDHCKRPIELDGGNLRHPDGRQDYWHKLADGGHSYSCSVGSTQATRNGRDWETVGIVETVQLPEPKPVVCDHCHRAFRKSHDLVDRWEHADNSLLHCDIDSDTNNNRATVNGSLYVDGRKEPTPEPAPKTIKKCDHCGKEIEPDASNIFWRHKENQLYHCLLATRPGAQASLYGTDRVMKPEAA